MFGNSVCISVHCVLRCLLPPCLSLQHTYYYSLLRVPTWAEAHCCCCCCCHCQVETQEYTAPCWHGFNHCCWLAHCRIECQAAPEPHTSAECSVPAGSTPQHLDIPQAGDQLVDTIQSFKRHVLCRSAGLKSGKATCNWLQCDTHWEQLIKNVWQQLLSICSVDLRETHSKKQEKHKQHCNPQIPYSVIERGKEIEKKAG